MAAEPPFAGHSHLDECEPFMGIHYILSLESILKESEI